jgi:hypothetical protein
MHGSWMIAPDIARVKLRKRKLLRDVLEYPGLPPGANLCRADGASLIRLGAKLAWRGHFYQTVQRRELLN